MKRLTLAILVFIFGAIFLSLSVAQASSLAWDYPDDWDNIDGYTVHYSDTGSDYTKSFLKSETTNDGETVTYADIEENLNLQPGVDYDAYLTAYNSESVSDASNSIVMSGPDIATYTPPEDSLPQDIVIVVPKTITIRVVE